MNRLPPFFRWYIRSTAFNPIYLKSICYSILVFLPRTAAEQSLPRSWVITCDPGGIGNTSLGREIVNTGHMPSRLISSTTMSVASGVYSSGEGLSHYPAQPWLSITKDPTSHAAWLPHVGHSNCCTLSTAQDRSCFLPAGLLILAC